MMAPGFAGGGDPLIGTRLLGVPLALADRGVFGALALARDGGAVAQAWTPAGAAGGDASGAPYDIVAGVAVIPVTGLLLHRHAALGCVSYPAIRAALAAALADESVGAIALDIDSPGGEVAGCVELATAIYGARGGKPIWAICADSALSAAYIVAAAADRVVVPASGSVGGGGVLTVIPDLTGAMRQAGITMNVITFGGAKADGLLFIKLSQAARARFQAQVNQIGRHMAKAAGRFRGVPASAIIAQEGRTFLGRAGVRAGLADAVGAPFDALAELAELARGGGGGRTRPAPARGAASPAMKRPPAAARVPARSASAGGFDFLRHLARARW